MKDPTFWATVVLVGVTAWYAYLTRGMARAAGRSATAAETAAIESRKATAAAQDMARTAERSTAAAEAAATESSRATAAAEWAADAARDAAQVAQSQIEVDFACWLVREPDDFGGATRLVIRCTGDAVVVQDVTIRRAHLGRIDMYTGLPATEGDPRIQDLLLSPEFDQYSLPRRVHRSEQLLLVHPDLTMDEHDEVAAASIAIRYTFVEAGSTGGTRVIEIGPADA